VLRGSARGRPPAPSLARQLIQINAGVPLREFVRLARGMLDAAR
jgi:hypothetical protein